MGTTFTFFDNFFLQVNWVGDYENYLFLDVFYYLYIIKKIFKWPSQSLEKHGVSQFPTLGSIQIYF